VRRGAASVYGLRRGTGRKEGSGALQEMVFVVSAAI
jgi:hypothetical protein